MIRGQIAAYGNLRGKSNPVRQNSSMRGAGKPAYPDKFDRLAPKANQQPDEGFAVQEEPLAEMIGGKFLRGVAAAGALAAAQPTGEVPPPPVGFGDVAVSGGKKVPSTMEDWISEASRETGIQPEVLHAVIAVESMGDHMAVSHKGAKGMMQLMPKTALEVGVQDPHDPRQNIIGGARYLQKLANKYHGDMIKTIAAYNAGTGNVSGKHPSHYPHETRKYVQKVMQKIPTNISKISYHPMSKKNLQQRSKLSMRENGGAGVSQFPTDLSGNQQDIPGLDDAAKKNGDRSLSELIGASIMARLVEDRATSLAVTGGKFEPFHRGHSAVVRKLASMFPKVVIFVQPGGQISNETNMQIMRASMPDIWDKIEIYPGTGDLRGDSTRLAGGSGTTMNTNSQVGLHPMPEDDEISAKRVRDALLDDEKDMVRRMLDPHVATNESTFEQLYGQMRRELRAGGEKPVDVVTDAPVVAGKADDINEITLGSNSSQLGWSRAGSFGKSAWSGYNPRNKEEDGDTFYQQMIRSPSSRMLDMTNPGTPDNHMPGEELDHELDDEYSLNDPTDLSEMILQRFKTHS